MAMGGTPFSLGFYMPAEWAEHEATYLAWPKNPDTFPKKIIGAVEGAYCRMAGALSSVEKVKILVDDEREEERVEKILEKNGVLSSNVLFLRIKSIDVWVRDYGPIFLLNKKTGKKAAVKWIFNSWGNKYDDLLGDNATGERIADSLSPQIEIFRPGIVMEGGSIEVNGEGALLTTEQCLLNKNRNPHLNKKQIETSLADYLGIKEVVWLKEGIAGDDTDGHVDEIARFVEKNTVICAREKNSSDPNYAALEKNSRLLADSGFEVLELPMPSPIVEREEGRRLPASYANFYIANKCVLVPAFGDKCDVEAADVLQSCFPGRQAIPIPAKELVRGYGGIHCVTQQEPK